MVQKISERIRQNGLMVSNVSNVSQEDFEIFEKERLQQCISRLVQLLLCGEATHFHVYDEQKRYGIQYRVHILN